MFLFFFSKLVFASFFVFSLTTHQFAFGLVTSLPDDEVQALGNIGKALGKNWDFSVDPCSGKAGWVTNEDKYNLNNVTCSQEAVPHVISITLKRQNLRGMLPAEMVNLPYLQTIDLTRNYLNGTLTREWSSLKLVNIILVGNRISGSIPKELGNIPTLQTLLLKYNQLSGGIPAELGNLTRLERLHLNSNYLSGELPKSLASLTNMKDFSISDNNFTGSIPDFIQSWTSLEELSIQGSGLNGPIPSSIASLVNLTDLRISDLSGDEQLFPPLNNMTNMKFLILRSCNINGMLPKYLAEMSGSLQILDLSFNNLSGEIPKSFTILKNLEYLYLTGNSLTGSVPGWFSTTAKNTDLSYNNFTIGSSRKCQDGNMNLFGNYNSSVQCSSWSTCQKTWNSLHINCGGEEVNVGENTRYEKDTDVSGASRFVQKHNTNWGFSNTGDHDMNGARSNYIWKSESNLSMPNSELYTNARISSISLSYYAFCMGNRNYKIKLHFAEIMFTDDQTYSSLGRRLFDVYIQGKLVQKDFNIAAEAGGVGKAIVKNFNASVTNNTLEIRFYWAGKGTDDIPDQGVYGPLISAISVDPAEPIFEKGCTSLSAGAIVGIVVAILASTALLVLGILWWKGYFGPRNITTQDDHKGLDLKTGLFTLRQIKAATNNFSDANKIGEGGFGSVYKGVLSDGTVIAVKQLSSKSSQGNREFLNEIAMISALQHPHLVKLYGCCIEENQLLLVYEYLENNSLAHSLFGSESEEHKLNLDWPTRQMICVGIAKGLAYLHEESRLKIVHRDIKATNVLLDKDLRPKISDFGLAKLEEEDNTHISTRIAGTFGYMAPEYALRGYLTDKADVYSFGIVALEIVSGKSNRSRRSDGEYFNLLDWALVLKERGDPLELVDPRLGSKYKKKEAATMINVALLCANASSASRPNMSTVVSILEGKTSIDGELMVILNNSSVSYEKKMKFNLVTKPHHDEHNEEEQILRDGPCSSSSSSSAQDLYSMHLDSYYLDNISSSR